MRGYLHWLFASPLLSYLFVPTSRLDILWKYSYSCEKHLTTRHNAIRVCIPGVIRFHIVVVYSVIPLGFVSTACALKRVLNEWNVGMDMCWQIHLLSQEWKFICHMFICHMSQGSQIHGTSVIALFYAHTKEGAQKARTTSTALYVWRHWKVTWRH